MPSQPLPADEPTPIDPPAVIRAHATLRIVVGLYALGLLQIGWQRQMDSAADNWQSIGQLLAAVSAATAAWCWSVRLWPLAAAGAAIVVLWQTAAVLLEPAAGPEPPWHLRRAAQMVDHLPRLAAPIALAWLWRWRPRTAPPGNTRSAGDVKAVRRIGWFLAAAAAAMFLLHAAKLIFAPDSVEVFLTRSFQRWYGYSLDRDAVQRTLWTIAAVDLGAVAALAIGRTRGSLCYMALWGMMTAASRVSAYGLFAWEEAFLRSANGGAALAALFLLECREPANDESCVHQKDRTT